MSGGKWRPIAVFNALGARKVFNWMPDEMYLKIQYRLALHKKLDLKNPVTYNEKIQWLKIHDRKPEYTMMVDKYAVRDYIEGLKKAPFYRLTSNVRDAEEAEAAEILSAVDNLSDDDLTISSSTSFELCAKGT